MKQRRRVIIWLTEMMDLIDGKPIGGIAVQMHFWAQVFAKNGWQVFSFADHINATVNKDEIVFKPIRRIRRINFILEWWWAFKYLIVIHPKLIIYRGANRSLLPVSVFARIFGIRLVFFSASDVNFEPGKEMIKGELNRKMYHRSIKHIRYFVTQNQHQHDTLYKEYGKESLIMYNIWGHTSLDSSKDDPPKCDVVWVANYRKLKRAEWVVDAAEQLPDFLFAMAGGRSSGEGSYYDEIQRRGERCPNLKLLGGRSFFYTNELVARSKVLLCTSVFEGFPNTFLQAWSNGIPVISTVDPSCIIVNNGLGVVVSNQQELVAAILRVLRDEDYYKRLSSSVSDFFMKNHAAQSGFERLIKYLDI